MPDPAELTSRFETCDAPEKPGATLRFRERVRLRHGTAELLVFIVGRERFGVELRAVDEVVESPQCQPVPEGPKALLGVFSLRDQLLPLYSPAQVLGPMAHDAAIALVMRSGPRRVGLAVDDVEDVVGVSLTDLRDAPTGVNDDEVVAGLLWRDGLLITVLDARTLVATCASLTLPSAA
jgi:purine-binding chemotaxis protein CheW